MKRRLVWSVAALAVLLAGVALAVVAFDPVAGFTAPPQSLWYCRSVGLSAAEPGVSDWRLDAFAERAATGDLRDPETLSTVTVRERRGNRVFWAHRKEHWIYVATGDIQTDAQGRSWLKMRFARSQPGLQLTPLPLPPR